MMRRCSGATLVLTTACLAASGTMGCSDDETSPVPTSTAATGGAGGQGGGATGGQGGSGASGEVVECHDRPPTKVIGNWNVVPHQRLAESFELGVVAFHEEGVDVRFSVDGADVAFVEVPTFNARTGTYEYWFALDPSAYADGEITVTATIVPDCPGHLERDLDPLTLYADAGGSLHNPNVRWADCASGDDTTGDGSEGSPYRTIEKAIVEVGDGGTVHLKAGTCYELTADLPGSDYQYWTTVRPAPGVARDQVQIVTYGTGSSTGRFGETMIRWQQVGLYKDVDPGYSTIFYLESGHRVWFDGAELYDARGQWNGGNPLNGNSPYSAYYTDAYLHDISNAGYGFGRNVTIENIGSDIFRGSSGLTSINLTVRGIDRGTTDAHPDFFQFYNPDSNVDNVVVYNTKVYDMGAQGIFGGPGSMENIAFVNLLMEKDPADSALSSQLTGDWNHVLLWHVTTVDAGFMIREPTNLRNFFIQNGVWANLHAGAATTLDGFTIEHNHVASLTWEQSDPMGEHATVGDPLFVDVATDDYHLQTGSPAAHAGVVLPGVPADVDGTPYHTETPSLGSFAQ